MAETAGPFKIILSELAGPAAADLGNPAADRVEAELARLLDLDEGMAASIVGAMPIVIVHGLTARQAGTVRERLQSLVHLGCKVVTTDEAGDNLPHVNWPVLPLIAQVHDDDEPPSRGAPRESALAEPGTLTCPSCFSTFRLSPTSAGSSAAPSADRSADRAPHSSPSRGHSHAPRAAAPPLATPEEFAELEADDDWMSPPVTRVPGAARVPAQPPEPAPEPDYEPDSEPERAQGGTARFNEAALLAYARADEPPPPPPAAPPLPAPLQVSFSDSQAGTFELGSTTSASGLGPLEAAGDESSFEATGSLHDSGSDILDLDPPHREAEQELERERSRSRTGTVFEDDFDLLGAEEEEDEADPFEASTPAASRSGFEELSASSPRAAAASSFDDEPDPFLDEPDPFSEEPDPFAPQADPFVDDEEDDPFSDQEFGRMLASDDDLPPPRSAPTRGATKKPRGGDDDLDDVLRLFGPEDEQPLDDMAGLEPAPLDLNPRERRPNPMGSEFQSDILEPLNPSEAMEIIKSQKTRGGSKRAPRGFEDDDLDLFGDSGSQQVPAARSSKKKTRGVPFSASGEDLDLFEESRPPARAQSKARARSNGGGADPFARARQAMDDERGAAPPSEPRTSSKRREGGRSSSRRSRDRSARPEGGGGGGGGGPAPTGAGDHGLVLSRIADPDKKEKAAELIAEIKGCNLEDAARLTERTIIPVLKGVSRDVAEFHLEKFRRYKIAGRVTTRQRS